MLKFLKKVNVLKMHPPRVVKRGGVEKLEVLCFWKIMETFSVRTDISPTIFSFIRFKNRQKMLVSYGNVL